MAAIQVGLVLFSDPRYSRIAHKESEMAERAEEALT
jgi:hypothetical protein